MPGQQRSLLHDSFLRYTDTPATGGNARFLRVNGGGYGNQAAQEALRGRTAEAGRQRSGDAAQSGETGTVSERNARAKGIDVELLERIADEVVRVVPQDMRDGARPHVLAILRQAALKGIRNTHHVAYLLATAEHESQFGKPKYRRSQSLVEDRNPIRKRRNGRWTGKVHMKNRWISGRTLSEAERKYWDALYGGKLGNRRGTSDAMRYRGRGYVQLTGRTNYRRMSRHLTDEGFSYEHDGQQYGGEGGQAIDLLSNPEHVNEVPDLAARILVDGSEGGMFTGKELDDYIKYDEDQDLFAEKNDFRNARRVINGDTRKNGEAIARIARRYAQTIVGMWPMIFPEATPDSTGVRRGGGS